MSDQGIWFKLWDGWENDADLANLSKEDLLHWVLLGGYLKKHGNNGMTCLSKPAIALQKKLMLTSYEAVINVLKKFPNCVIGEKQNRSVTNTVTNDKEIPDILTITWKNWRNYQGDSSRERMRRMRKNRPSPSAKNVTIKKRGEEKRGEEKRFVAPTPPQVKTYGLSIGYEIDGDKFCNYYEASGWKRGKNQIRNWKAAVRLWKQNEIKEKPKEVIR